MEDVSISTSIVSRACWADKEEEALIGRSAKAQHRRHQCEGRAASLFVGQIWEDVHDDAVGGVEASVEMGVPGSAEHHVCIVGPRLGKCRKMRRTKSWTYSCRRLA